jgi:hypothetical protein
MSIVSVPTSTGKKREERISYARDTAGQTREEWNAEFMQPYRALAPNRPRPVVERPVRRSSLFASA